MNWLAGGLRSAAVASAALLIAATTTADASHGRLKASGPYWIADGRQIAFTGWYGHKRAKAQQWMMNADGSHKRAITPSTLFMDWFLSPSGRLDARAELYADFDIVWIYGLGKTGLIRLGKTGLIRKFRIRRPAAPGDYGFPDWSPDERAFAMVVDTGDRSMIVVAELRDGLHLISHIRSRNDISMDWSPDSRRIALLSCAKLKYRSGLGSGVASAPCNVVLIRRDGSGRTVVVRNAVPTAPTRQEFPSNVQPVWAPSGRTISYAVGFGAVREKSPKGCPKCIPFDFQRRAIYVVRPDGSGLRRLATTSYLDTESAPALAWSPDSRRLAFADTRGVTMIDIKGGRQHRLTSLRHVGDLSWAPSRRLLFSQRGNVYTALPGHRPQRIFP
jgi:Tol biopolymer transport system component